MRCGSLADQLIRHALPPIHYCCGSAGDLAKRESTAFLKREPWRAGQRRRSAIAAYNADVAMYRQTVLTAFEQVEDYLAAVRICSQQILREKEALKSAEEYLNLAMGRYETGVDPSLNVPTTQTTVLSDEQTLVGLQIQQMVSAVNLIEALGGGWDRSQLPTPSQVTHKPPAVSVTVSLLGKVPKWRTRHAPAKEFFSQQLRLHSASQQAVSAGYVPIRESRDARRPAEVTFLLEYVWRITSDLG